MCILCGGCVDVCPEQCLELVSLERFEFPEPVLAHLEQNESAYESNCAALGRGTGDGNVSGAAMVKDETRCIRCGLCAMRCPVKEITMEAFHFRSGRKHGADPDRVIRFEEQQMSDVKTQEHAAGAVDKDCDCKDSSRRQFFAKFGMGSLAVAAAGAGLFSYEYLSPNVLFESAPIINAGKPDQFAAGRLPWMYKAEFT